MSADPEPAMSSAASWLRSRREGLVRSGEVLVAAAIVWWRCTRTVVDEGPIADWVLILALLWLCMAAAPRAWARGRGLVLALTCLYLFLWYGYYQMGATVEFFWKLIEGQW